MYKVQLFSISKVRGWKSSKRAHFYRPHSHGGIPLWNEPSPHSRTLHAEHVPFGDLDSVDIVILVFLSC
jgi:hypothetical protein